MRKTEERVVAFTFGVVFVVVILGLAVWKPEPSAFQYTVFRIVLALAAAGVAVMLPGFIEIEIPGWLRAGGALAVFAIVYFYSPAALTVVAPTPPVENEIDKPIVVGQALMGGTPVASGGQRLGSAASAPTLRITDPGALTGAALSRRYERVVIDGVRARFPPGATLVANEVEGVRGGALVGADISVLARRLANIEVDVSAHREPGAAAGAARLYVKTIENATVRANGSLGATPTQTGERGPDGAPSVRGIDGDCGGFGRYRGATAATPGGDAGDGRPGLRGDAGSPGGLIHIVTMREPSRATFDVSGGPGGAGGAGGPPGTPGAFAQGGRGCTGLGGTQPNQADAPAARAGATGPQGPLGGTGTAGERRVEVVRSFDPILSRHGALTNEQLGVALRAP